MKKVKMGIVGTGPRIVALLKLYIKHPQLDIVAVCDKYEINRTQAADAVKSEFPFVKCFESYEDMLKNISLDALLIGIDPQQQVDMACDAMQRGIHVMTEVPAAYTIDQCHKLVQTVEKTGAKYQLAEQTRYWNFICKWREMSQKGDFGKVLLMEGEYMHYEKNWDYYINIKTGERICGDVPLPVNDPAFKKTWRYESFRHPIYYLPHTLSPLLSIVNDRVQAVSCMGTRLGGYQDNNGLEVRDIESAIMHTENDVLMRVSAGFTSAHGHRMGTYSHWYQVRGTQRTVEWARSEIDKPKMWTPQDNWQEVDWGTKDPKAEQFVQDSGHGGADWWPIDSFVRCILEDTIPPMHVYRAVESAAPAILAAQSAELGGQLLQVPDFRINAPLKIKEMQ